MLQGCAILVFTISLNGHVFANTCEDDKCITAMDIPLITQLNAPLKAELDISILTEQLKELITHEVKQAVSVVTKDLAEGIVDKKTQSALENLQIVNNQTISTFLKEMKDVTVRKRDLSTVVEKLEGDIKQMKEQQKLAELKLSSLKSDVTRSTERVAMTAFVSTYLSVSIGSVVKFSDVKFSEGMGDLSTFKSTGKFKCERSGLYILSVTLEFDVNGSEFYINVNGKVFTKNYKQQQSGWWHSSSAVIAIELNTNDTVWVQVGVKATHVRDGLHSRFTIIKIH
ncbi:unnamed protein product [Mytilus edulis]|uniref:C1q domain-containing protein n=1 Tax=Mytilus edulis TaxID=6550 RepID=A0A8S3T565_MYTED|nr:unnamed protein product [Mytilus edulis]